MGYKHSEEVIEKIRLVRLGTTQTDETKQKISESLMGKPKTRAHKKHISKAKRIDLEKSNSQKLKELIDTYPEHIEFFESNRYEFYEAFKDVKSDKDLEFIRSFIETEDIDRIDHGFGYVYPSSSTSSQENLMIEYVDRAPGFVNFLDIFENYIVNTYSYNVKRSNLLLE